jgi:xylulokinase
MIKQQYILALDAGTTSVKTVLFDTKGKQLSCAVCEYHLEKPCPNYVEVDPEVYWQATVDGIAEVIRDSGITPADIAVAGVTSQGETLIILDDNGKPLRKAIVWLDNRSHSQADTMAEKFDRKAVYEITGQQEMVPTWTATKILWLRENEPDVFAKVAKFLMVEDYLIYRLTGKYATDHSLNPSTLYYDLRHGVWWQDMLDFLGISTNHLPELKNSGEIVGNITAEIGLTQNTVVTTAPIDQIAAAVGSGNIKTGMVTETTGSALAICATLSKPVCDPKMQVGLYRHALPEHFILMPWVPTAGMVLRWFRDELGRGEDYAELSSLAEKISPGSDGLLMLPHLSGAFSPEVNPAARGVFYGISLSHSRGHFVRAIFESVAYMLRDNIEMLEELGLDCSMIYSLGGGARNPIWVQIKADVLNKPISVPECDEATCLGTAILATIATSIYSSVEDAVQNMVRCTEEYQPRQDAVVEYEQHYQKYLKLNKLLIPTFGD